MASPAQLVETTSRATGVPLATVVDIDRRLTNAKLRAKTGRGRNVARMTALDAARLLTAVLASPQANLAATAVQRYALTGVDRARSSVRLFATAELDDLAALPEEHSFIEGLAAVIVSVGSGALARLAAAPENAPVLIEVFAFTRATRGRLRIAGLPNGLTASLEYGPSTNGDHPAKRGAVDILNAGDPTYSDQPAGDLEQSRRVNRAHHSRHCAAAD